MKQQLAVPTEAKLTAAPTSSQHVPEVNGVGGDRTQTGSSLISPE